MCDVYMNIEFNIVDKASNGHKMRFSQIHIKEMTVESFENFQ